MTESVKNLQDLGKHMEFETEFLDPKRREVFLVDLNDVAVGTVHIIQKTRPAVIIQNDIGNVRAGTVIIAFLTTTVKNKIYPMHYRFNFNNQESTIMFEQIMTIDKNRLIKKLGELTPQQMKEANKKLMYSLELSTYSLENIQDIDVINRTQIKTRTEEYIAFTVEISFTNYTKLEIKINLDTLKKFDETIDENIGFEDLKKKLDCCRGLNWLVNNCT